MCTKAKTKFEVKENATTIFSLKRSVPFAAFDPINKELERLENLGFLSKVDYSEWALPTVYMKKKNNKICVCAGFSTGLNDSLQNYNYLLPSLKEIFAKLNSGKFLLSWTCQMPTYKILGEEEYSKLQTINTKKVPSIVMYH